jgi:hypothetical protein
VKVRAVRGATGVDFVVAGAQSDEPARAVVLPHVVALFGGNDVVIDVRDDRVRIVRGREVVDVKVGRDERSRGG